ncbi:GIY-YIG nuclease family protein [Dyadobacter luticola]|uniref:GIY-YIG nuclease family protein n=1 Tax=Dyadobacter luticola TaxID=1979387 RepID=A0A5R9L6A0_9BACT|nr:GIY-YIG nuclease family protein [Dyadobacter luticola]
MHSYFVYIVKCSDGSYYTGITNNMERRVAEHNSGLDPFCYTFKRRPVEPVFSCEFNDPNQAIAFEKQVKGWGRKKKEALIADKWDDLKPLAECRNGSHWRNWGVGDVNDVIM